MTGNEPLVRAILDDYTRAEITPAERVMLDHVVKLTREPWAMVESDIQTLRDAGWSDGAIHDLTYVAGYYAFVNRLADGLGVALEPRWDERTPGEEETG